MQERLEEVRRTFPNRNVFIDGPGWRNAGNQGTIDLSDVDVRGYVRDDYDFQITKITEGCPNQCPFCFSGPFKELGIPEFKRNKIKLTDENILAHHAIIHLLDLKMYQYQ